MKGWRTVQEHPVKSEAAHGLDEGTEFDRLAHVTVGAEVVAGDHVRILARRRENDDWQHAGALVRPQAFQHAQAIELGELQVQQNHCGNARSIASGMLAAAEQEFYGLDAVAHDDDVMCQVVLAKAEQRQLLVVGIVFHQQNKSIRHHCPHQS